MVDASSSKGGRIELGSVMSDKCARWLADEGWGFEFKLLVEKKKGLVVVVVVVEVEGCRHGCGYSGQQRSELEEVLDSVS